MPPRDGLHCHGTWLEDSRGRVRLLRGVNVSGRSKLPPFLPFDDPAHFDRLANWGMNAVRLLVLWEGLEPERGAYDHAYVAKIRGLAEAAGARGLAVVIDFHQDLFARAFGGDGAPAWAVGHRGRAATGREWFWYYGASRSVQRCFADFWRDERGIRSAFLDAVAHVMTALGDVDAVVGYDLFNEPMAPLDEVVRGRFEQTWLSDFHRACIALRDRLAPGRLLLLEPTPLAAFGVPTTLDRLDGRDLVYAPHLYDATAFLTSRFIARLSTFPPALARVRGDAATRDWPLLIGEFGVLGGIADAPRLIEDQCRQLDHAFASWTAWHYNPTDVDWNAEDASIVAPDGSERPWTAALVRPYPRALAGRPRHWDSRAQRPWTFAYDASSSEATELVIPPRWSPAPGIRIEGAEGEFDGRVLTLRAEPGTHVRVVLRRAGDGG